MKDAPSRALLCDRTREWAALRLDTELSEFEQALMAAHLERCEACRAFAADVRGFTVELRGALLERPGEPVALPARPRVAFRNVQVAAAAAVFVVAAGLGGIFGSLPAGSGDRATQAAPLAGANPDAQLRALRVEELKDAAQDAARPPLQRGKIVAVATV